MELPPIPPKSNRFTMLTGYPHFRIAHRSGCFLCNDDDIDRLGARDLIAAVAEVEWRKRADRWEALRHRIVCRIVMPENKTEHSRWKYPTDARRLNQFSLQRDYCKAVARLWREWAKESAK